MEACVIVGEPAETLPQPVPHTAVGSSSAYDRETMASVGTPCSWGLDQKPKLLVLSGTHSLVKPGAAQPLWTLIILFPEEPGWTWAVAPVDCFSIQARGGFHPGSL